jgi:hypothetical protein
MNQYRKILLFGLDFLHLLLENEEAIVHYLVHVLKSRNTKKRIIYIYIVHQQLTLHQQRIVGGSILYN